MVGVPQELLLGPALWNELYDEVLDLLLTEVATSLAFADVLALVLEVEDIPQLTYRVNESLKWIMVWMERRDLESALQKSVAIVTSGNWTNPKETSQISSG